MTTTLARMKQNYRNKIPPFKPDPEHWTRKGPHGWKAKLSYPTEEDAWEWLNQNPRIKAQGYTVYHRAYKGRLRGIHRILQTTQN